MQFRTLLKINHRIYDLKVFKVCSKSFSSNMDDTLKKTFEYCVKSVQPNILMKKIIRREGSNICIDGNKFKLRKNVYIVGFGKAVIGMVRPLEDLLTIDNDSHLVQGIISVPFGIQDVLRDKQNYFPVENSRVDIFEGAFNNIPDLPAYETAKQIVELAQERTENELLFVLISGGGSALFPIPCSPLSLDDKKEIINKLSRAGATINELNAVRKAISNSKGGNLAKATKATVVSLILSDVINSPLDIIGSGPTVPNLDTIEYVENILRKYDISITEKLQCVFEKQRHKKVDCDFSHVKNVIIGSNETALSSAAEFINEKTDFIPIIVSSSLKGEAKEIGKSFADLSGIIIEQINRKESNHLSDNIASLFCITEDNHVNMVMNIQKAIVAQKNIILIFGGETTVTVKGDGTGGRNQEMVLAFTIAIKKVFFILPRHLEASEPK